MTDYCYPTISTFECDSPAVWLDTVIGIVLSLPVLYMAVLMIKESWLSGDDRMKHIASYFILNAFSFVSLMMSQLVPAIVNQQTYALFIYQVFPRCLFCLSHCVLAEQTAEILCLVKVPYSKILRYTVIGLRYVFIVFSTVLGILTFVISEEWKAQLYSKVNFYSAVIYPLMQYSYLILHGLFILITTLAFVFIPRISQIFNKKFILNIRKLLLVITFFLFVWNVVYTLQYADFDIHYIIIADNSIEAAIITVCIENIISEYIPRTIYAGTMWYMSHSTKEEETHDVVNKEISQQPFATEFDDLNIFPT